MVIDAAGSPPHVVLDLYAPYDCDYPLLKISRYFWDISDEVGEWLAQSFSPHSYEVRRNSLEPVEIPVDHQVVTHHTYVVLWGDARLSPHQQAMLFKLAWSNS